MARPKGSTSRNSPLTPERVNKIIDLLTYSDASIEDIARRFSLCPTYVSTINAKHGCRPRRSRRYYPPERPTSGDSNGN